MGAGSFNPAHPCEMSKHLGSGLSAYADNGCGHVSSAFPGCAVERSPGEGSLASLPSRVRPESHRVGPRSVLAYGLYFLTRILSVCRFGSMVAYARPDLPVLSYPIYVRLVWVPAHQSSDPSHGYPDDPVSDTGPHTPSGCPAHT